MLPHGPLFVWLYRRVGSDGMSSGKEETKPDTEKKESLAFA